MLTDPESRADRDWYLDHVLINSEPPPESQPLGPAAAWQRRWAARAVELQASNHPPAVRAAIELALRQGSVLGRAQLAAAGVESAPLRRMLRHRQWSRPRRNAIAVIIPADDQQRIALAVSALALVRPGSVISHSSAAVLHGLPTPQRTRMLAPEFTVRPGIPGGRQPGVLIKRATLGPDDIVRWFGVPVTQVARTVVDLARAEQQAGLVTADAALRELLTTRADLNRAIEVAAGWPGVRGAAWVIEHADPRAESPLESLTRGALLMAGLPAPELQVVIRDPRDGWRCRVDLLYRAARVVIEADGRLKYTDDELWREKVREERLQRLGWRVERILWRDLEFAPAEAMGRVRAALTGSL